jgi:hypothetical protein
VLFVIMPLTACSFSNWHRSELTMNLTSDHIAGSAVEVRSRNGRIEVVAVPNRTDIAITAKIYARGNTMAEASERLAATTLLISRTDDGTLLVEPQFPEPVRGGDGANILIELPDANGATLRTSNGSVHTYGLTGRLIVDTSNGSVEILDHQGETTVDTSNGSITVDDHDGVLSVDTSNGSVRINGLNGPVKAKTSNGSIVLSLHDDQSGPIDLDTSNGSITVRVGASFAGTVTLDTSNGSLTVRDHIGRISSQTISKSYGRIVVGEGGKASRLDTSNGRIRFTITG